MRSNRYRIETVKTLLSDILKVTSGEHKSNRFMLADVYQCTIAAEPFFPRKPVSIISNMPLVLRKKVDLTCPACIKPAKMKEYEDQAKRTLKEYAGSLKQWLQDNDVELDESGNPIPTPVNKLGPTKREHI